MSSGHGKRHKLTSAELDDLLDEALADNRVKRMLATPFNVITSDDIPLLGSSSVNRANVYLDRHLPRRLPGIKIDNRPGLIKHERLEPILEDVFGWSYDLSHDVATHYENRDYAARGCDPEKVEKAYEPFIKADEHEKIVRVPTDLDWRPMMADEKKLLAHVKEVSAKEKLAHEAVGYEAKSTRAGKQCGKCAMFREPKYGGPACTLVKSPIVEAGYCRRFVRGKLDQPSWQ